MQFNRIPLIYACLCILICRDDVVLYGSTQNGLDFFGCRHTPDVTQHFEQYKQLGRDKQDQRRFVKHEGIKNYAQGYQAECDHFDAHELRVDVCREHIQLASRRVLSSGASS